MVTQIGRPWEADFQIFNANMGNLEVGSPGNNIITRHTAHALHAFEFSYALPLSSAAPCLRYSGAPVV
jgi:hypothetical protein